ncbi:THUMP domain-containing class I SAM-dependent RNA methyltransferase [Nannocystaceae bacterium ST9]
MSESLRLFVACAPGLEPLLADELRELELDVERSLPGGVELVGDQATLDRVLLGCGLGLRVLVRVAGFVARDFAKLERELDRLDWTAWIRPGDTLEVRATARRSRLHHTGAIAERVERAVARQLALGHEQAGGAHTSVYVRNEADHVEVSIDACGAPLHKRGWRLEPGKAPLREDIARALLRLVGFQPDWALLDPVAGSGTLVIEAATIAAGLPPGLGREFACQRWPGFDARDLARARARFTPPPPSRAPLIGRDRNEGAATIANHNAARAHVDDRVQFESRSLGDRTLPLELTTYPGHVALLANPPWGHRVGDVARLRNLYAALGNLARTLARTRPIHIGLVTPDRMLAGATGLGLTAKIWTDQGGTRIGLWTGELAP